MEINEGIGVSGEGIKDLSSLMMKGLNNLIVEVIIVSFYSL